MTTNNPNPVFIALCGATGTGKSTFINDASGAELPVGHSPSSCTIDVAFAPCFELDGRQIQLIDTPGFDDTTISDADILQRIGDFLKLSHLDNQHLSGIIYMHRITDNRVGGISRRNFHVFREICGENTLKNVVITTNMWQDPHLQSELDREKELRENPLFFQPALAKGARMARYVRSRGANAAHDLIRMLVNNTPLPTYLGGTLADGVPLGETNPGKALNEELQRLLEKQKAEIDALRKQMEDALRKRDQEAKEELEEERRQSEKRYQEIASQIRNLNATMEQERASRDKERAEERAARASEQAARDKERAEERAARDKERAEERAARDKERAERDARDKARAERDERDKERTERERGAQEEARAERERAAREEARAEREWAAREEARAERERVAREEERAERDARDRERDKEIERLRRQLNSGSCRIF